MADAARASNRGARGPHQLVLGGSPQGVRPAEENEQDGGQPE